MQTKSLLLNRNGAVNNAALNAGQVAIATGPTGYAMFSDPFFFLLQYMLRKGAEHICFPLAGAKKIM